MLLKHFRYSLFNLHLFWIDKMYYGHDWHYVGQPYRVKVFGKVWATGLKSIYLFIDVAVGRIYFART